MQIKRYMTSVVELPPLSRLIDRIYSSPYERENFWNSDHVFRKRMQIIYLYNVNNIRAVTCIPLQE